MYRYSRQREVIKEYLMQTHSHPTAEEVYLHVKGDFPRISLGTVYRNLNLLSDLGDARKVITPEGSIRFDGNTQPHSHVICTECSRLFDLDLGAEEAKELEAGARMHFKGEITGHRLLFYGICEDCTSK